MLFYFVLFGWLSQAVPYYRSVDYSVGWSATLVAITAGGSAAWLLTAGRKLERFPRPELAAVCCAAMVALSMLALWFSGGSIGGVAAHIPLYILGGSAGPPLEALIFSRAFGLRNFATIMGTAFMFQTIGIFVSPIVAGEILRPHRRIRLGAAALRRPAQARRCWSSWSRPASASRWPSRPRGWMPTPQIRVAEGD